MRAVLGFHYRATPEREIIYEAVRGLVSDLYAFDEVYECDSGQHPYSRAASRNLVVQRAIDTSADVVVICDADSVPQRDPLREAIESAHRDGRLHVPFTSVSVLSRSLLRRKTILFERSRSIYTYGPSCGGIYIIRPSEWVFLGGMDERIVGWGYEDEILLVAASTFLMGFVPHPGNLYTFNHSRGVDASSAPGNIELRDSYNQNSGNAEKIREIQRGSNKWCQ